jgi:hypothetical protein
MPYDDPGTWVQAAGALKSTFEGFRAALGLIKDARGLGSENPEQAKAITAALDQAEAGAKVAEAQIAKALGYELCKCQNRNRSQNDHGLAKHQTHSVANRIPRSYALALATGHTGWDGLGDGGAHAIVPTPARKQQRSERRYDPWGHWGAYYGPMIAHP